VARVIEILPGLSIPLSDLRFQFARSGGPGGQNVNKVETKVQVSFDVVGSPHLTDEQKKLILNSLGSKIIAGTLRVSSQVSRSQIKNREDAQRRIITLLKNALRPRRKRLSTKPTGASRERRRAQKERRSEIKRQRRNIDV
jgi:ribosome-associated protein